MSECVFELDDSDGRYRYVCQVCHRDIVLSQPANRMFRQCTGNNGGTICFIAAWPTQPTRLRGIEIVPWRFVYVPESWLADLQCPYELIENDASYFGTRLKEMFAFLGYDATEGTGCQCNKLANALDTVSLEFIQRHRDSLADQIVQSAAQRGVVVSHVIIDKLIGFTLWKEQRRINRQKSLPKHSE